MNDKDSREALKKLDDIIALLQQVVIELQEAKEQR